MAKFPTTFAETTQPLPSNLGDVGDAAVERLAEKGFEVVYGLTEYMAGSMATMAVCDKGIQEYCPKDSQSRFATMESTKRWLGKHGGRGVLLLLENLPDDGQRLAGYGWTGLESSGSEADVTFALRVGPAARGKKLAADYSRLIVSGSAALFDIDPSNVTLETWASNIGAGRVYEATGFVETHRTEGQVRPTLQPIGTKVNDRIVYEDSGRTMVEDTRRFMAYQGDIAA